MYKDTSVIYKTDIKKQLRPQLKPEKSRDDLISDLKHLARSKAELKPNVSTRRFKKCKLTKTAGDSTKRTGTPVRNNSARKLKRQSSSTRNLSYMKIQEKSTPGRKARALCQTPVKK